MLRTLLTAVCVPQPRLRRVTMICSVATLIATGLFAAGPAAGAARTCRHLTLDHRNSGQSLVLHVCDRVTIRLAEQSDGGYTWRQSKRPAPTVLKLVSDKTVVRKLPPGAVGGSDTRVFVYRAVAKGKTSLKLTESRPFMRHSQIASFTLAVRVK